MTDTLSAEQVESLRDKLWEASFEIYYESFFEEMVSDRLLQFWSRVDDITKWLVALTASGSAVAGWALWGKEEYGYIWAFISMIAGFLSITHSSLGIQSRIKTWAENKKSFVTIRMKLEAVRQDMKMEPMFDYSETKKSFIALRDDYQDAMSQLSSESFRSSKLENKVQDKLNKLLKDQIEG